MKLNVKTIISGERIVGLIFALGVYLKEFYILPSGSLQLGDVFLLLAFIFALLWNWIRIDKIDRLLGVFVAFAVLIDLIYVMVYKDASFVVYASYLVFSFIMVLLFRASLKREYIILCIKNALKCALVTQVAIRFLGKGNYLFDRYTGSFNDPNQFGYYVLMAYFLLYIISVIQKNKDYILWFPIAAFLIVLSESSGMVLGMLIFGVSFVWYKTNSSKTSVKWIIRIIAVFFAVFILLIVSLNGIEMNQEESKVSGIARLFNRLGDINGISGLIDHYIKDRSISRVVLNPLGLLYGTGEGLWERYVEGNEIHATMIALMFYYGIIPYLFFIRWIYKNVRGIKPVLKCVLLAQIIEAFTLTNHRQPFFWMLFVMLSIKECKRENQISDIDFLLKTM